MKALISATVAALLLSTTTASAHCDINGNCYNVTGDPQMGYHVNGMNTQTGSMWNTNIRPNGDQNGFDSNGNAWNYNRATGSYFNFGTGKMCTGTGAGRICN